VLCRDLPDSHGRTQALVCRQQTSHVLYTLMCYSRCRPVCGALICRRQNHTQCVHGEPTLQHPLFGNVLGFSRKTCTSNKISVRVVSILATLLSRHSISCSCHRCHRCPADRVLTIFNTLCVNNHPSNSALCSVRMRCATMQGGSSNCHGLADIGTSCAVCACQLAKGLQQLLNNLDASGCLRMHCVYVPVGNCLELQPSE
jgi:hypothetical protein